MVGLMQCVGIDIVEIERIQRIIDRWGTRFLGRIYTDAELDYCHNRLSSLAVRFAGKEAVMKALSADKDGIAWRDIEILPNERNTPQVILYGRARIRAEELGVSDLAISLSHSRAHAVASVVGYVA